MTDSASMLDLLGLWQAFSQLQQRAFEFLALETLATGQEFENSTMGATVLLNRVGQVAPGGGEAGLKAETNAIIERLQSADRSRQGLEQVASVLYTLRRQHAELEALTQGAARPVLPDAAAQSWIDALAQDITLADWRRRLVDALNGIAVTSTELTTTNDDIELF